MSTTGRHRRTTLGQSGDQLRPGEPSPSNGLASARAADIRPMSTPLILPETSFAGKMLIDGP